MAVEPLIIDGIPVNPSLPKDFFWTENEKRPQSHLAWWGVPFIQTCENPEWPEGIRFDVYVLDGGVWDRPTSRGWFSTLEAALRFVKAEFRGTS